MFCDMIADRPSTFYLGAGIPFEHKQAFMRPLFRFLAFLAMATSVIAAVVDATRSLSGGALMLTSLSAGWSSLAPVSLASVQSVMQEHMPAFLFDPVFIFVLSMPAVAVFAVMAVFFYAIGAKRERSFGKISM